MPGDNKRTLPEGRGVGLDAVRFAAALMVLATHWGPGRGAPSLLLLGPWGGNGVALFFVLSGYLLWRPFVDGRPSVYRFALARAARILPAWWLAALVLVPIRGGDLAHYLAISPDARTLGIAWTLQAEVMFYLAVPLLALFRRPLLVPVVCGLASFAVELWATEIYGHGSDAESMIPVRFWQFAPGMVLAASSWRPRRWALFTGVGLLCVGAATNSAWGGQWTNVATEAGAVFVVAAAMTMAPARPEIWAAGAAMSYGLYLWHVDLIELLGPWLGLVTAFAVASLSYLLLERPVMRWVKDHARRAHFAKALPISP